MIVLLLLFSAIMQFELMMQQDADPLQIWLDEDLQLFAMQAWRMQHHYVVGAIALFALVSLSVSSMGMKVSFFIFQTIGFGILLFADVYDNYSILSVFFALVLQMHVLFENNLASSLSILYTILLLTFPRIDSAWYYIVEVSKSNHRFTIGIYAMLFVLILHVLHSLSLANTKEVSTSSFLKKSVMELSTANVGFQEYASKVKEVASREERNRIIREVHDSTGYTLTNITMMMEAAQDLVYTNPAKLKEVLSTTKEISQSSLQQIRKTLRMLGQEKEQLENPIAMLHKIFLTFEQATNIKVQTTYRNLAQAPLHLIDARLFRIVQESLTNAFWHGEATKVSVQFWYENGLTIIIADNGKGSENIVEGIGLRSMREQLSEIQGTVEIHSIKGAGFMLEIFIPPRGTDL